MPCFRSICIWLLLSAAAFAQTAASVIFGTVTDSSGSAIPNVPVTATATATEVATRVMTNESGNYIEACWRRSDTELVLSGWD